MLFGMERLSVAFLDLDILNGRPDIAAMETTGHLAEFSPVGEALRPCPIRSPLKAAGRPGFAQTIFPQSHEAFDILCIGSYSPVVWAVPGRASGNAEAPLATEIYLNSALDVAPIPPLPIAPNGVWTFRYEFVAIGFPLLSVSIEINLDSKNPAARLVDQITI